MDDEKIIDLYWSRDETAIAETDKKYGITCLNLANKILYNLQDAEECVSDTYYGLWNAIPPTRPHFFPAFIAKITRNLAMKKITYANAKKRVSVSISFHELEDYITSSNIIDENIQEEELAKIIEIFLKNLDYESRNIFLRRYWFFDSIIEIAQRFSISESKVKSQLYRVRSKLKKYLEQKGYMDGQ